MPCQDYPVNKTYHLIQDEMFSGGRLFRQNDLETNLYNLEGNTGISDVLSLVQIETLGKFMKLLFDLIALDRMRDTPFQKLQRFQSILQCMIPRLLPFNQVMF